MASVKGGDPLYLRTINSWPRSWWCPLGLFGSGLGARVAEVRVPCGPSASHVRPRRHRPSATDDRRTSDARFATWCALSGTPALA